MVLTGYLLSTLIAVGIVFIGSRFLWDPAAASRDFGIPNSPSPSTGFTGGYGDTLLNPLSEDMKAGVTGATPKKG